MSLLPSGRPVFREWTYTLPFPPSVNTYWGSKVIKFGKRLGIQRFIDKAGKTFRKKCKPAIDEKPGTRRRLEAKLVLCRGDAREYDIDNFNKAVWDALQHYRVFEKDSQIDRLIIERGDIVEAPGFCIVTLREIGHAKAPVVKV